LGGSGGQLHVRQSEFWTLIEQARADVGDHGRLPSGSVGAALADRLARMPLERIVAFDVCRMRVVRRAHQWGVCAATFVVCGYLSDDTFSDFKAGLLGLGQDASERVVDSPDALTDLPVIRAVAAGLLDRFAVSGEAIDAAAPEAYERLTGDADAFCEALQALPTDVWHEEEPPPAVPWSGRFGSPEDTERIPAELPRLHALFNSATR
jgi:hypothetical protein